jgi:hypothetical protein
MDWNVLLYAGKWLFILLFYSALAALLSGVYREAARHVQKSPASGVFYGRLRVVSAGSDEQMQPGMLLTLKMETTMGSDPESDIVLRDRFISRRHARMQWDGAIWWLEDLGSKNGTLLNGQPCPPQRAQMIPPHASITLGDITFELVD